MGELQLERPVPSIQTPEGWRDGHLLRGQIPVPPQYQPDAFSQGLVILASHRVREQYVSIVRRVEAGVFKWQAAAEDLMQNTPEAVQQIDQLHWWAELSDQHVPWDGGGGMNIKGGNPGPAPVCDWKLELVTTDGREGEENAPPHNGDYIGLPFDVGEFFSKQAAIRRMWPALRFGLIAYSAHVVVVGPRWVVLAARWKQPPRGTLPWGFAQSWGLMEGVDLRHDDEDARRVLLGGIP